MKRGRIPTEIKAQLTVHITVENVQRLRKYQQETNLSMGEVVDRTIEAFFKKK